MAIGTRIREARFAAGMTQAALARATGVSERNIVRWENDQHAPRGVHVAAIAKATGKATDFFFAEEVPEDDEESDAMPALDEVLRSYLRKLIREEVRA